MGENIVGTSNDPTVASEEEYMSASEEANTSASEEANTEIIPSEEDVVINVTSEEGGGDDYTPYTMHGIPNLGTITHRISSRLLHPIVKVIEERER